MVLVCVLMTGKPLDSVVGGIPPPDKPMCLLALSPALGVGQLPIGGLVVGRYVTRLIKGRTLFADKAFQEVGLPFPAIASSPSSIAPTTVLAMLLLLGVVALVPHFLGYY